jgi:hypothetical protein
MVNLKDTLKMIIPYYWNPGKSIIDVTAGKRLIWGHFGYNHLSPCGFQHWDVEFNDVDETISADYHIRAEEIDKIGKRWDILVCDFPFVDLKLGVESFGVRTRSEVLLADCVKPFNKVADNLIIKMGNSHKNNRAIMNCTEAELAFDHKRNNQSDFHLIDSIGYRGNYARRGGKFPFAQSVLSYYMIFKKNPKSR